MGLIELHYKGEQFYVNAEYISVLKPNYKEGVGCKIFLGSKIFLVGVENANFADESCNKIIQKIKESGE